MMYHINQNFIMYRRDFRLLIGPDPHMPLPNPVIWESTNVTVTKVNECNYKRNYSILIISGLQQAVCIRRQEGHAQERLGRVYD